jgi:hypothetical protein
MWRSSAVRAAYEQSGSPSRARCRSPFVVASLAVLAIGLLAVPSLASSGHVTGGTRSLRCRGGSNACKAVVSLAGGASRVKLKIALSDTDLKLTGVVARPASIRGAYQLLGGAYSLGGSLYTVTLNAVQAIPKGATLTLSFAVPPRRRGH